MIVPPVSVLNLNSEHLLVSGHRCQAGADTGTGTIISTCVTPPIHRYHRTLLGAGVISFIIKYETLELSWKKLFYLSN